MPVPTSKLDRPALAVVLRIARRQLHAASTAWERLRQTDDAEALHDFRVAIRRLRSTLQAYRPQLAGVVRAKDRRRLRGLAGATGPARDAEVQLARLRELRAALGPDGRADVAPLARRLRARMRAGYAAARDEIAAEFPRTARGLDRRLRRADAAAHVDPFRLVLGRFVATHTEQLRPVFEAVPAPDATRELHQARIEAKRLRYVLEPVERDLPGSTVLVHRLERVQDVLGEVHDLDVLDQTLATTRARGLTIRTRVALARLIRDRRRRAYVDATRVLGNAHAHAIIGPLELLAARLGGGRRPTLALGRSSPAPRVVTAKRR